MTLDLDKLEALAKAATPGPWKSVEGGLVVCSFHPKHGYNVHDMRTLQNLMTPDVSFAMGDVHKNDSAFIASAREAVPALIARVRELEADRDRLKDDMGIVCRFSNPDWREKRTDMEQCLNEIHGNAVASYWFHNRRILKGDKT
jgi:hypothetical protein